MFRNLPKRQKCHLTSYVPPIDEKELVFEGCQNCNQMFLYIGHTDLQNYTQVTSYLKNQTILAIIIVF